MSVDSRDGAATAAAATVAAAPQVPSTHATTGANTSVDIGIALPTDVLADHERSVRWARMQARRAGRIGRVTDAGSSSAVSASAAASPSPATAASVPSASSSLTSSLADLSTPVMRINQLDADALDHELFSSLSHSFRRCFRLFDGGFGVGGDGVGGGGGGWVAQHRAEMELLVNSLIFRYTIGADTPTPGMRLQNVRMQDWKMVEKLMTMQQHQPGGATVKSNGGWIGGMLRRWLAMIAGATKRGGQSAIKDSMRTPDASIVESTAAASTSTSSPPSSSSHPSLSDLRQLLGSGSSHSGDSMMDPSQRHDYVPRSHFPPLDHASVLESDSLAPTAASTSSDMTSTSTLLSSLPSSAPVHLSTHQKIFYFLFAVLGRYGWSKLHQHMLMEGWGGYPSDDWHRSVYEVCRRLEQVYQVCNILNFIAFLNNGHYRSLLERVLRIRLIYLRPRLGRQVSFEFMNQALAWATLADFMLFILPNINWGRIQRMGEKAARWMRKGSGTDGGDGTTADQATPPLTHTAALQLSCTYCRLQPAFNPHYALPCRHVFCYYCLAGNRLAEQQSQGRNRSSGGAGGGSSSSSSAAAAASSVTSVVADAYACPTCNTRVQSQMPVPSTDGSAPSPVATSTRRE